MSKILLHSLVFSPDGVSTAYLYNDIALAFKAHGHEVIVLTTTPHYNSVPEAAQKQPLKKCLFGLYYCSDFFGIRVIHIPQKKFKNTILRIFGFIHWHLAALMLAIFQKKIDLILSPSPPLSIGFINILVGKFNKAKVVYNVQEIYPDILIESGMLKSKSITLLLKNLERFIYNKSDLVVTIDTVFKNTIINRFKNKEKLKIIPNFVDTDLYKPIDTSSLTHRLFKEDTINLMYAGNIGFAQDWIPLIELAKRLKSDNFAFYVIGEGVMKPTLEKEISLNGLTNIHILPYQPRESIPQLIAESDLQFIFMSPSTEGHGFPSKVYTILACGKPLLISSGDNTPIVNFLRDKNCAYIISDYELKTKVDQMESILRSTNKQSLKQFGINGLKHIEASYSKKAVTEQYVNLVNSLLS